MRYINVTGVFEIPDSMTHDEFLDKLVLWLEENGCCFAGGTKETTLTGESGEPATTTAIRMPPPQETWPAEVEVQWTQPNPAIAHGPSCKCGKPADCPIVKSMCQECWEQACDKAWWTAMGSEHSMRELVKNSRPLTPEESKAHQEFYRKTSRPTGNSPYRKSEE